MEKIYRIALAGNPNSGKSTVFNELTGARQHVGNYSGVTVERKIGSMRLGGHRIEVVDLPGTYSLSSASPEERIAVRELILSEIDLVLNVVDAGNLNRNLYLSTQLAELELPMILVFNMIDEAEDNGMQIDLEMFGRFFGAPVVPTVASRGRGIDLLRETINRQLFGGEAAPAKHFLYGDDAEKAIGELANAIAPLKLPARAPARWYAIKLMENDRETTAVPELAALLPEAERLRRTMNLEQGMPADTFMADRRYGVIAGACKEAVRMTPQRRRQLSDRIDKVVTHRWLGIPIFLLAMFLVFTFTFELADPMVRWIEAFLERFQDGLKNLWPEGQADLLRGLVIDGAIGGVGSVLTFLPNILLLFLAIAFLEGTGYMARAAFIMDGFMHKIGLHGKSFIPMLLGFGCSVPAVMATRTIESERDRLTTIMVLPLMSCSARLPIYALLIPAFFSGHIQPVIMWSIYLVGIVLALICARVLKSTIFRGDDDLFVMELPPYRMPTFRALLLHMWERSRAYLKKAGTLILAASVILYCLNTFPVKSVFSVDYDAEIAAVEAAGEPEEESAQLIANIHAAQEAELLEYSVTGRIGKGLAFIFQPLGFDWKISASVVSALPAKELFVAQMGILYSIGDADEESTPLRDQLRRHYTPLTGFAIMLFCLISMPCIATVAVVRRETNSWKLTLLQLAGLTVLAYLVTLAVYQAGTALGIGTSLLG